MTFTYTGTLASLVEKVRFLIGDTSSTDPQLTDEEISGASSMLSSTDAYVVAQFCVQGLVAEYARQVSTSNGVLSISAGDRMAHYQTLLDSLRRQRIDAGSFNLAPYVGGVSVADVDAAAEDSDDVQPSFTVGMHDAPATSSNRDETPDDG
jgi:hypothetical protein